MKRRITPLLVMSLLFAMALGPWQTAGADDDSAFTIDKLEIDVVQMTNDTSFLIIERVYLNNTGDTVFNGTLHHWLSKESEVFSMACVSQSTTVMRRVNASGYGCYNFTRDMVDENIIAFTPFDENESLSYYGQEGNLILNASNANGSSWHSVPVNITVGWGNQSKSSLSSGQGLTMNVSLDRMEAKQPVASQIGITTSQWLNVTNDSLWNETVSLSVGGLPEGWEAHFYNETSENDTLDLLPSETKAVRFEIELPPHRISMEFLYVLLLDISGDERKTVTFEQVFLHNVSVYSLWLFPKSGSTVSLPGTYSHSAHNPGEYTFPNWLHSIYIFDDQWSQYESDLHDILGSPSEGETLQITIEWEETTGEELPLGVLLIAMVAMIIATAIFILLRTPRRREEDEPEEDPVDEAHVSERRGMEIAESLREAEAAFAAGHLSKAFYEDLRGKYESEMEGIEEVQEDPEVSALKGEKDKLLRAIKALRTKLDEGRISKSSYQQLVKDYKERAIEIMREIDKRAL
ncbi:MAG: hypothetical protein KAS60_00325 [Thermoplasmata archaeon]|nr:hypothetical protein [Thermoplasmata archaeon]